MTTPLATLTLESLRQILQEVEPTAPLVDPRVLRRVIWLDRRLTGPGFTVPHHKSYVIPWGRLLAYVDRAELELPPTAELPGMVILLTKPANDEALDLVPTEQSLRHYWRLLFHARVHTQLERRMADYQPHGDFATERRRQIGAAEFVEIRSVLLRDELLFPEPTDVDVYIEFAAVYLELRYFAQHDLPVYFPAVRDWQEMDRIISQDVYHSHLLDSTRLTSAWDNLHGLPDSIDAQEQTGAAADLAGPSPAQFGRLQGIARRAANAGKAAKAAVLWTRAAGLAAPGDAAEAHVSVHGQVQQLVGRLQLALQLSDEEQDQWAAALRPLLERAADDFRSPESRVLYALQKVYVEHERGVLKLDPIQWLRTWGRSPLRRPLPLLREVLITKHLRTAQRRAASTAEGLAPLLAEAVHRVERRLRDQIRPLLMRVLNDAGLVPQNLPERVARRKLVEELLDRIVEQGFLHMGDLRDALSRSDLKLPDLSGPVELLRGDRLLCADRKLAAALPGVYRPGAVYLRWPQRISSLAFGTSYGRFVTRYIALPFGGAFLALEGLRHAAAAITRHALAGAKAPPPGWEFFASVLWLGTILLLLMHWPEFRTWCLNVLWRCGRLARQLLVDIPADLFRSPLVQRLLHSQAYSAVRSYLLRPALFTLLASLPALLARQPWSWRLALDVFLVIALFLNSNVGRYADEWITDLFVRIVARAANSCAGGHVPMDHGYFPSLAGRTGADHARPGRGVVVSRPRQSPGPGHEAGGQHMLVLRVVRGRVCLHLAAGTADQPDQAFPGGHRGPQTDSADRAHIRQTTDSLHRRARANTLVWSTIWLIPGAFGFLVWELKENWRLYAANRPRTLKPLPIGHHGETMVRLLRPGFHSGTLPKLFARLRRASRKARRTGDYRAVNRQQAELHHVREAVGRFVDRELCALLGEAGFRSGSELSSCEVHVATNRVEVLLCRDGEIESAAWLTWEEDAGTLAAGVSRAGWLESLPQDDRLTFTAALTALLQRSGADEIRGPFASPSASAIAWDQWVRFWSTPASSRWAVHNPETAPC